MHALINRWSPWCLRNFIIKLKDSSLFVSINNNKCLNAMRSCWKLAEQAGLGYLILVLTPTIWEIHEKILTEKEKTKGIFSIFNMSSESLFAGEDSTEWKWSFGFGWIVVTAVVSSIPLSFFHYWVHLISPSCLRICGSYTQ